MNLLAEKQKTKIVSESGIDTLDVDCFVKKYSDNKIVLAVSPIQKNDFSDFEKDYDLDVKVFTPNGILIFKSKVLKIISSKELEISFDEKNTKLENTRQNPRYQSECPITIFRPLQGNIESHLIDISVRGLRFYSEIPLDVNSEFEIMLNLSNSIGKIILTGRILDKTGLPEGVHRMIIEKISYSDRQKLVDYCMSLAK
ncbi:MAG: PilZ domain-containing protein [Cyanobacteria bacterium RUI128]|nr:PilZ domain-containing protein [Cyanobacteria bacterium RUI128]